MHRLSAYGAQLLGDAASGDDVAQSALLKAYGALRDGRLPDRVKPWLYRIAHNTAIDLVVRRRELPSAELPEGSTGSGEPVERCGALVAALASHPERQRRVQVLRELHGLRIDETTHSTEQTRVAASVVGVLVAARTTVPRVTATVSHRNERGGVSEGSRVSGSDGKHGDSGRHGRDDGSSGD